MNNSTLSEILSKYYVTDSPFTTHVSMVNPKGTYQFDRNGLEELWEKYGEKIMNTENPILGIAEKSQNYLPVLVDLDLKIQEDNDFEYGDHLYNEEHVLKVIEIYQSVLRNIVRECTDNHLMCVLLEKPIYRINKGNISYLKNGFHMHFPNIFLSKVDQKIHLLPRVKKLMNEYSVFSDLGIEDSGSLVDESYCTVPWLMYGSSKENMEPYKISKIYNADIEEISLEKAFKNYQLFDRNEQLIKLKGKVRENLHRILSIIPYHRSVSELKPGLPSPLKASKKEKAKKANIKVSTAEALKISAKLLPMLSNTRAEDRNEWMTIGWILFNIGEGSQEALELWCDFSSRSEENYDEATCIFEWERMVKKDLGLGTLHYYASIDNPAMYEQYKRQKAEEHVKESLNGSHNDIAKMLYCEYGNEFVCASIDTAKWFQFMGNHWEEIEGGVFLRKHISEEVVDLFVKMSHELLGQKINCQDKAEASMYETRLKSAQKMIQNLKSAPFKNNIMREAVEVFYDKRFQEKLDTNPYLFPFSNGVYDLKLNIFRAGRPEDFISKCSPIDYIEMDESDDRVIEVYDFLNKVFPDTSVRKYFMDQSSDIFVGGNHQKVVLFWTGEGDNGKSVTQSIFEKMLGPLAIKFSTTLITGKKTNTGSANPELARAGGGVRWAVLEEPDGDEQINIGMMKSLSGNDSYWARDLFEKGKATREILPMFKLIFICLSGETSVSLSSGISVSIEKMRENYDVLSWDIANNTFIETKQQAFLDRGEQECICLTLLDGRQITCTPDHKFLDSENNWIEAKNIKIGETKLSMGITYPKCDDIFDNYNQIIKIGKTFYTIRNFSDCMKAIAASKMVGYTNSFDTEKLYLNNYIDVQNIHKDTKMITNKDAEISLDNDFMYGVKLPSEDTYFFEDENNILDELFIPDFIQQESCPTFLIREFLGGLFGKHAKIISSLQTDFNATNKIQLSFYRNNTYLLMNTLEIIAELLITRFNIECEIKTSNSYFNDNINVVLTIQEDENILSFIDNIGVRYSLSKSYTLMAIGSVIRYKKTLKTDRINIREFLRKTKLFPYFAYNGCFNSYVPNYQMTVVSIEDVGLKHVYDINVEEPYSNFIAEGVVSHNCNKLPKMKYSDPATWNRIRVIPFESTFVRPGEPCPETYEEQLRQKRFPMDKEFSKKIPSLLQAFVWVLLEHRKNIGVRMEPEKVRMATAMYRKQNDIYRQFVEESIIEDESAVLPLSELYMHFKEWFREGFPGQQVPVKNEIFEYFERLWGTPLSGQRWRSYRIRTLQDDIESGNVVILDESDLITYDEHEEKKPARV